MTSYYVYNVNNKCLIFLDKFNFLNKLEYDVVIDIKIIVINITFVNCHFDNSILNKYVF